MPLLLLAAKKRRKETFDESETRLHVRNPGYFVAGIDPNVRLLPSSLTQLGASFSQKSPEVIVVQIPQRPPYMKHDMVWVATDGRKATGLVWRGMPTGLRRWRWQYPEKAIRFDNDVLTPNGAEKSLTGLGQWEGKIEDAITQEMSVPPQRISEPVRRSTNGTPLTTVTQ